MKRSSVPALTIILLALVPRIAWGKDQASPLKQALGAAHLARAELSLLKGQLNRGKVHLAAAHEADPSISLFGLKALDMRYKDFPTIWATWSQVIAVGLRPFRWMDDSWYIQREIVFQD